MKRILLLPIYITLLVGVVYGQDNPDEQAASWQRYTVKGEEFSIEFPTHPAMTTYKRSGWGYRRDQWRRHLGAYADGVVYTVFGLDDGDPRQALKASIEEIVSSSGSVRSTEKDLSVNGFSGKQYFGSSPLGETVQVFATKNRFYHFRVFGAKAEDPRVKQFFSSISLGKKVEGIEVSDGQGVPFKPTDQFASSFIDTSGKAFVGREVDRKAILVMKPEPAYTDAARKKQITGTVVLKVVFSSDGSVVNIRTAAALPEGLTEKAIDAARKLKFIPAMKDGKFVSMWMQVEYNFNLY
ncbi:MAG TPA: energy transducer TonB [Pyrinomonadaceae bacterium]|nr:energy transducer TonB [Pyrinomonadaceae bacterium]